MFTKRMRLLAAALLSSSILSDAAFANFSMNPGGTTTAFAIDAGNQGSALCAAASTECPAAVPINTAGAPFFTSAAPGLVSLSQGGNTALVKAGNTAAGADLAVVVADPNVVNALSTTNSTLNTISTNITNGYGSTGFVVPGTAVYMGINSGGNLMGWTGAVTSVDGGITTLGLKNDSECGTAAGNCTTQAILKFIADAVSQPAKIVDAGGVNIATVKAASTPSVAADTAAVTVERAYATPLAALHGISTAALVQTNLKNGAGTVRDIAVTVANVTPGASYVRLYDAGTGFAGCNSATGIIFASAVGTGGFDHKTNLQFVNGLSICISGAAGDTDTSSTVAGLVYNTEIE